MGSEELFDEELQNGIESAWDLPRISESEMTRDQLESACNVYGNNFYMLFDAMLQERFPLMRRNLFAEPYLEEARSMGENWETFLAENTFLIEEILAVLHDRRIARDIDRLFVKVSRLCSENEIDAFLKTTGLQEVRFAINLRLNPLLKLAEAALREKGIDAKRHFFA